ncbi:MAG: Cytoskeleton protein RodZ [Steroidobacteraceae bacterium]|nr:Cytoskeleton protein RodZ [Steroidobacteraceae bacterium]
MTELPGAAVGEGIGARLRAARERAGLTSLQAAAKLHLEPQMIEALETDDFAALGAPVYVRGHLRRYAELLDAPAGELLDLYAAQVAANAPPDIAQLKTAEPVLASRQLAGPVVAVIVAGTVIAGIWLALKGLPTPSPKVATPVARPVAEQPAPVPQPLAPVPAPPAAESGATPPATEAAATPVGAIRLRLVVQADSWIEVHDARNARLYYDLAHAPATLPLAGTAPLRVLLGNVDGVTLTVNGRALPIPQAVRRGRSARFVITAGGDVEPAS